MKHREKVFMTGIGGIGMSALAQMLAANGAEVSGSDRAESPVTKMLTANGIPVVIGQNADNVPEDTTLLVYTAAVPEDHAERARARERSIPELSYFEALGRAAAGKRTIAITGTHGKTTVTGMLSHILIDAGLSPTCVIGSLVTDLDSNYVQGESDLFVVEACEYHRHFMNLSPEILVVNNIEYDHTDYFADLKDVQNAFRSIIKKVPEHGVIVTDTSHPTIAPLLEGVTARIVDYTSEPAYALSLPGEFNVANAKAAAAAAKAVAPALSPETIAHSLLSFKGTWRRFEYKGKTPCGARIYDDYAHHPTAIRETLRALKALKEKQGARRITVIFHPHLFSRTRDLLDGFARAFGDADETLVVPIFAARELDDGSISSEILVERIREEGANARAVSLEEAETAIAEAEEGDIVMTMGAGDIYKIADRYARLENP
jgi:UDP-N-acetylmuramate--alanine ligase